MLHIVLADGFEEIEALATIDILRRCGLEVQIISVTGKEAYGWSPQYSRAGRYAIACF